MYQDTKNSFALFYCDTFFISVMWTQAHISEVCFHMPEAVPLVMDVRAVDVFSS